MAKVSKKKVTKKATKKPAVSKKGTIKKVGPGKGTYFSKVQTSVDIGGYMVMIHGVGGVGKTSFAAHAPNPVFLIDHQELGIFELMNSGQIDKKIPVFQPPATDWQTAMEILEEVENLGIDNGYKTLVIDSLTGFETLCFRHHCNEAFDGDWSQRGFFSYQQGPRNAAKTVWPDFLSRLFDIRASGMNVILIGHSQIKNFNNPEGPDYERWQPYLDKETWAVTYRAMETVLFANHFVDVKTEGGRKKGKGTGGEQRFLYTEWNAAYDAKNRWGLPDFIDMGSSGQEAYNNFSEHITW